jgi:hypothetical protein
LAISSSIPLDVINMDECCTPQNWNPCSFSRCARKTTHFPVTILLHAPRPLRSLVGSVYRCSIRRINPSFSTPFSLGHCFA